MCACVFVLCVCSLQAADVEAAKPHIEAAHEWYKKAHAVGLQVEQQRKAEQEAKHKEQAANADAAAAGSQQQQQEGTNPGEMSLSAHAQVLYGNTLYEWSQVLAAVGQEWRHLLDDAAARFRDAGCAEKDIRSALKNHTQVSILEGLCACQQHVSCRLLHTQVPCVCCLAVH